MTEAELVYLDFLHNQAVGIPFIVPLRATYERNLAELLSQHIEECDDVGMLELFGDIWEKFTETLADESNQGNFDQGRCDDRDEMFVSYLHNRGGFLACVQMLDREYFQSTPMPRFNFTHGTFTTKFFVLTDLTELNEEIGFFVKESIAKMREEANEKSQRL